MSARYVFAATQPGLERPLKNEIAREHPGLRFAFSRPGFVTFRGSDAAPIGADFRLRSVFARTWGFSLGKINGADDELPGRASARCPGTRHSTAPPITARARSASGSWRTQHSRREPKQP